MTSTHWIEWLGGECPVPLDAVVQAKFRNGTKHTEQANWWAGGMGVNNWKHSATYPLADIVAYRIIPSKDPNNGE